MDGMNTTQERVAEGFCFYTKKDAELAALERRKTDYMETRMDYSRPESILRIYDKAIHDRIFKTPVGISYLKKLQDYLREQDSIDQEQIAPIPLFQNFEEEVRVRHNPPQSRVKPSGKKEKKSPVLSVSILLNVLLGIAMIAMFAITLNANQPNILNYEKAITNQYATWEQELTEREQAVREKERELQIEAE